VFSIKPEQEKLCFPLIRLRTSPGSAEQESLMRNSLSVRILILLTLTTGIFAHFAVAQDIFSSSSGTDLNSWSKLSYGRTYYYRRSHCEK
jgi:hypothetical protein